MSLPVPTQDLWLPPAWSLSFLDLWESYHKGHCGIKDEGGKVFFSEQSSMGLLAAVLSLGRASSFLPYRPTFLPALTGLPIRRHYIPPWLTKDSFLSVGPVSFVPKSWRHFGMTNGNDRTLNGPTWGTSRVSHKQLLTNWVRTCQSSVMLEMQWELEETLPRKIMCCGKWIWDFKTGGGREAAGRWSGRYLSGPQGGRHSHP